MIKKLLLFLLSITIVFGACGGKAMFDRNLIKGGSAERTTDLNEWKVASGHDFARASYKTGWAGKPPRGAGKYFFFGDNGSVTVYQDIDICNLLNDIDRETVFYTFSGYHGGYGQRDSIELTLTFYTENSVVIRKVSTGEFTSNKKMVPFSLQGVVPAGTRVIRVTQIIRRYEGIDADGYSDELSLILHRSLRASYRMDECKWEGKKGEVKDSSGNGYDATAYDGAKTKSATSLGGVLCRAGDFSAISSNSNFDRVELPSKVLDDLEKLTVTMWFKTDQQGSFALLSAAKDNRTDNEFLIYFYDGRRAYLYVKNHWKRINLPRNYADGLWHFLAVTREDERNCVYIDDNFKNCFTINRSAGKLRVRGIVLGQDQDDLLGKYDPYQELKGYLDEVKIFDEVLNETAIKEIYKNEKNGKSWNGQARKCQTCCKGYTGPVDPVEFEGGTVTLQDTYVSPIWTHVRFQKSFSKKPVVFAVINSKGSDPASFRIKNITNSGFDVTIVEPQGEDGPHIAQKLDYFAITPGVHKLGNHFIEVGTISTKKVLGNYLSKKNDIGWQTIHPKVDFCDPAVAATIQTLNNEQNPIPRKPSKPWMTPAVSVDEGEIKVALDASETTQGYPIKKTETIGYMIAPANFTDQFRDDSGRIIKYEVIKRLQYFGGWDNGQCFLVDFHNSYIRLPLIAGWQNSRYGDNGGWFRRCKLSNKEVGFVVDEDQAHDSERWHVPEDGAVFVFSSPFHLSGGIVKNYKFDAIDTFRNIDDRNISTKITSQAFGLKIISLNESGNGYEPFEGTVCVDVVNDRNETVLGIPISVEFANEKEKKVSGLVVSIALKNARVLLRWRNKKGLVCPLAQYDGQTLSSDNFAIRPQKFGVETTSSHIFAAEDFLLNFKALDTKNNVVKKYNETLNDSFKVEANVIKKGCLRGDFKVANFSFVDGIKKRVVTHYDEVGELNITVSEIDGNEFALVDRDDTNKTQRFIEPGSIILKVAPYEINITKADFINSFGTDWLYMAQTLDETNVTINVQLGAFNKLGKLTQDYNESCYGTENIQLDFGFDINNTSTKSNDKVAMLYKDDLHSNVETNRQLSDLNVSYKISTSAFQGGEAQSIWAFGVDKNISDPLSPIDIQFKRLTPSGSSAKKHNVYNVSSVKTTFYYGRIKPHDLTTSKVTDTTTADILVYDRTGNFTKDRNQTILNWYLWDRHSSKKFGEVKSVRAYRDTTMSQSADMEVVKSDPDNGRIDFKITKHNDTSGYIHLNISPWLWFSYNEDAAYDASSDCAHHPCVKYDFFASSPDQVKSGEVTGVRFDQNVSKQRRGVKVFR